MAHPCLSLAVGARLSHRGGAASRRKSGNARGRNHLIIGNAETGFFASLSPRDETYLTYPSYSRKWDPRAPAVWTEPFRTATREESS